MARTWTAMAMGRLIVIDKGKIIADGPKQAVIQAMQQPRPAAAAPAASAAAGVAR